MPTQRKVALANIKTLTFQQGEKTAFRRTSAIRESYGGGCRCRSRSAKMWKRGLAYMLDREISPS